MAANFLSTNHIPTSIITGDKISANTISLANMMAASIDTLQIKDNAITVSKIKDGNITNIKLNGKLNNKSMLRFLKNL